MVTVSRLDSAARWPHRTHGDELARGPTELENLIGNTPMLELRFPELPPRVRLLAKAEWLNPGGSVKDRPARAIVRTGLREGHLPAARLLDASSGNTAIAYSMLGAAHGFGVTICLPANASPERKTLLEAYGAEVIETDPGGGSDWAIRRARELASAAPREYFYADQYNNPANARAHYETTGPEIWWQTAGLVSHLVAGLGTCGTLMGSGRYFRSRNAAVKLIAVEPDSGFHGIEGLKHLPTALVPGLYEERLVDRTIRIGTEEAYDMTRRLGREHGLLVGPSSGAATVAALRVASALEEGHVVVILPDSAARYLSLNLWREG